MRYVALASDYDGTIATHGTVPPETLAALRKLRLSGRKVILVTGRVLEDLESTFSHFEHLDCVVAENGAVLYTPATREKRVLAPPPKQAFLDALKERNVQPVGVGDAIVATWHPNETVVLEIIRDLGLELQVIFNKGAVMVLPSGINKRSGLKVALDSLGISEHNVVGVGDAENDHAFLAFCECSVAVANAHPAVKDTADLVTSAERGAGVNELIELILNDELAEPFGKTRSVPVGHDGQTEISIPAYGSNLLVAGASGSGKSTFVAGFLEILFERRYQVCLIDPEGDYQGFPGTIPSGDEKHEASIEEVLQTLRQPKSQLVLNLMGTAVADRPLFFEKLLPRLVEMRRQIGRPHWIVVDEAHHMLAPGGAAPINPLGELKNVILVTVHPDQIEPVLLKSISAVFAVGPEPEKVLETFASAAGIAVPNHNPLSAQPGQVLCWFPASGEVHRLDIHFSQAERRRHMRNYARGELGEDRSFYFRGPEQKLNLRAHNLTLFVQLAEGVDDETWLYHLKRHDYSKWFRDRIKDEGLADEVAQYEADESLDPRASREKVGGAVNRRYTAPSRA
jgi:phosphoglycolate phosphatase (TIGR01487 family)